MAKQQHKLQTGSALGKVNTFRGANAIKSIQPDIKLDEAGMRHFRSILAEREAASWTEHHIAIATRLAMVMVTLDGVLSEASTAPPTFTTARGYVAANPIFSMVSTLTNTVVSYQRSLGINASHKGISPDKQARAVMDQNSASRLLDSVSEDDLLAAPQ